LLYILLFLPQTPFNPEVEVEARIDLTREIHLGPNPLASIIAIMA
jgi:hypothetical protein